MSDDGFRARKQRPKGWMKQAINDGVIADPETQEHPTAVEIAAALHALSAGIGDQEDATALLRSVPNYRMATDDEGRTVLVPASGEENGVFRAPTARVTKGDD